MARTASRLRLPSGGPKFGARTVLLLVLLPVLCALPGARAVLAADPVGSGLAFLTSTQAPDGSWSSLSANPTRTTAVVLRALATSADASARGGAADFLAALTEGDNDELSRSVRALAPEARDVSLHVDALVAAAQASGGWGLTEQFSADPLDTALALEALAAAGLATAPEVLPALIELVDAQNSDGGWPCVPGAVSDAWCTAQSLEAIAAYRDLYAIDTILTAASDHLLAGIDASGAIGAADGDPIFTTAVGATALVAASSDLDGQRDLIRAFLVGAQLPDGSWEGDPLLTAVAVEALVALQSVAFCGDGSRNRTDEACDGSDLSGLSCETLGFASGTLACSASCTLDTAQCVPRVCGDGEVNRAGESCDGTDLGGATCESFGFLGGALACSAACGFDTSGCIAAVCGDGVVNRSAEACDGADLAGATCESLGFPGGSLDCSTNCTYDTTGCDPVPVCGDGVRNQASEACDGGDLAGQTCASHGFFGGTLACASDCSGFDTSSCIPATCGDGVKNQDTESCDGGDLAGASCGSLGFESGALACAGDCAFDTSACVAFPICGDDIINQSFEACDGLALVGVTCESLGFLGGTPTCASDCTFVDSASCIQPTCGDSRVNQAFEVCDGSDLAGQSCVTRGFGGGALACAGDCTAYDTSACQPAGFCGDGVLQAREECEFGPPTDLNGASCESLGLGSADPSIESAAAIQFSGIFGVGDTFTFDFDWITDTPLHTEPGGVTYEIVGIGVAGHVQPSGQSALRDLRGDGQPSGTVLAFEPDRVQEIGQLDGVDVSALATLGYFDGRLINDSASYSSPAHFGSLALPAGTGDFWTVGLSSARPPASQTRYNRAVVEITFDADVTDPIFYLNRMHTWDAAVTVTHSGGVPASGFSVSHPAWGAWDEFTQTVIVGRGGLTCHPSCRYDTTGCEGHDEPTDSFGREFFVAFMPQRSGTEANSGTPLFVGSESATTVTSLQIEEPLEYVINDVHPLSPGDFVQVPNVTDRADNLEVPPNSCRHTIEGTNQVRNFWVPGAVCFQTGRISALDEVVAYQFSANPSGTTNDSDFIPPVDALGRNYILSSFTPGNSTGEGHLRFDAGQFLVVAPFDNTEVTITPTADLEATSGLPWRANVPFQIQLQRGEGFFGRTPGSGPENDITGTVIRSNRPVLVQNGNKCTNIPNEVDFCDYLLENAPPVETWGTVVPAVSLPHRPAGLFYRVLASEDATRVLLDGESIGIIDRAQFIELPYLDGSHVFEADKPILVSQFITGWTSPGSPSETGDPSMVYLAPVEQWGVRYLLGTVEVQGPARDEYFLAIVTETEGVGSILLNGSPIPPTSFTRIGTSDFFSALLPIAAGVYQTTSTERHSVVLADFNVPNMDPLREGQGSYLHKAAGSFLEPINPVCGDAEVNRDDEQCDMSDLAGASCESLGFSLGTLACSDACSFDTTGCGRFVITRVDEDGDGHPRRRDCDDSDPTVNPGATEVLGNATDDDCNPGTPDVLPSGELSCRVTTDRIDYTSQQTIRADVVIERSGGTGSLVGLGASVVVTDAGAGVLGSRSVALTPLGPGERRRQSVFVATGATAPGPVDVSAEVTSVLGTAAACATSTAIVSSVEAGTGLAGSLEAEPRVAPQGSDVTFRYTVENIGNVAVDPANIELIIATPAGGAAATLVDSTTLPLAASFAAEQPFQASLAEGDYAVILRAGQGDARQALASTGLRVVSLCGNGTLDSGEACDDGNRDDGDGCSALCQLENEPPVAICQDVTAPTDAGSCTAAAASIDAGSFDPDGDPISLTQSPGGPYDLGGTPVSLTVEDDSLASAVCSGTVTVADQESPQVTCPNPTFECASPQGTAGVLTPVAFDNCSQSPDAECTPSSGSVFPLGSTAVSCSASDAAGNVGACDGTVTVVDTTAPTISCPSPVLECTAPEGASATIQATASDACSLSVAPDCTAANGVFPIGTTAFSCTATDASGNASSCSDAVTVTDTTPPDVTCPPPLVLECAGPDGTTATFSASASDVCSTQVGASCAPTSGSTFPLGTTALGCSASDATGNLGACQTTVTIVDTGLPATTGTVVNPNPVAVDTGVTITASAQDLCSDIASAEYSLDGGASWSPMDPVESPAPTADVAVTLPPFSAAGVFDVCTRATDARGNTGEPECLFLAVYDPDGGFVTGGGWIHSPAGAYPADPSLEGRANFGFVSKYKKGANVPTGNTQFHFQAGDLNFHSDSYDWLVIAGAKAMYKGTGTINGEGFYRFRLSAIDGKLKNGNPPDTFRIKIWTEDATGTETIIYDNLLDAPDDADPSTVVSGGNLVIHRN